MTQRHNCEYLALVPGQDSKVCLRASACLSYRSLLMGSSRYPPCSGHKPRSGFLSSLNSFPILIPFLYTFVTIPVVDSNTVSPFVAAFTKGFHFFIPRKMDIRSIRIHKVPPGLVSAV